jgi:DNA-binding NtrC family response regulator
LNIIFNFKSWSRAQHVSHNFCTISHAGQVKFNYHRFHPMKKGRILIIDDQVQILQSLRILLRDEYESIHVLAEPEGIREELKKNKPDLILLDMNFRDPKNSGSEGLYWLEEIKRQEPEAMVILITAFGDISLAVQGIKAGASDFITKPWDPEKLIITLRNAFELRNSRESVRKLTGKQEELTKDIHRHFQFVRGISSSITEIYKAVDKLAATDANVLILGENGTGKEVIAREIHRLSARSSELFLAVDLGSLADSIFESELFGHVKGSFTDAREDRAGRFETASGGTLFLDEIGNLSLSQQMKLLTVIQNREVIRLGSSKPEPFDVRLISATNRNLEEMVQQKLFREDLLYRINTIVITLPPLRERIGDIPLLAESFLEHYAKKYNKKGIRLSESTLNELKRYPWPGNIRELKHSMEKALILCDSDTLEPKDLGLKPASDNTQSGMIRTLEEIEKSAIRDALISCQGNLSLAAKILDISRTTLYTKIQKYGL